MIGRIVVAGVYGVLTALLLLLLGLVLVALGIPVLHTIGRFLEEWCWVFGLLAALLAFFGSWSLPRPGSRP